MNIDFQIRQAGPDDAEAIGEAHLDSIRSIGPKFYSRQLVGAWATGLTANTYLRAMTGGEIFFVAVGEIHGKAAVLGFSSHRVDDDDHSVSVYVRGVAARQGLGTALLRRAEEHARAAGATRMSIEASLPGVAFYTANGFKDCGPVHARLASRVALPCRAMVKQLTNAKP